MRLFKSFLSITRTIIMSTTDSTASVTAATTTDQAPSTTEELKTSKAMSKKERKRAYNADKKGFLKAKREEYQANKQVGYQKDTLNDTEYYFEDGLRKVKPYMFQWRTTAKERWFSRTLFDVYSNEFTRVLNNEDLTGMITSGRIKVNGQTKDMSYLIKNGDIITHLRHRHELPVVDDPIEIVADTDDILAINKPCSIAIHPCGKYRYNTLLVILNKEMNYLNLRTVYRLDRLTSGLLLLAKNFHTAKYLDKHIKERTAEKTYVSRVVGNFPDEEITVDQPLDVLSHKAGIFWVNEKGKESQTTFKKLSYNGKTSVVQCQPKTGRTHQIRIHLQYLGHPIVNDPLYNDVNVWGSANGKAAVYEGTPEEIEKKFLEIHSNEKWIIDNDLNDNEPTARQDATVEQQEGVVVVEEEEEQSTKRKSGEGEAAAIDVKKAKIEFDVDNFKNPVEYDPNCWECKLEYRDPPRDKLIMYLHAWAYKLGNIEYKTKLPAWASEEWTKD